MKKLMVMLLAAGAFAIGSSAAVHKVAARTWRWSEAR